MPKQWSCEGRDKNNNYTTAYAFADDWYKAKADFESRLTDVVNIKEVNANSKGSGSFGGSAEFKQAILVAIVIAFLPFLILFGGVNIWVYSLVKDWMHGFFILLLLATLNLSLVVLIKLFFDYSNEANAKLAGAMIYGLTFAVTIHTAYQLDAIWTSAIAALSGIGGWFIFGIIWSNISEKHQGTLLSDVDFLSVGKTFLYSKVKR